MIRIPGIINKSLKIGAGVEIALTAKRKPLVPGTGFERAGLAPPGDDSTFAALTARVFLRVIFTRQKFGASAAVQATVTLSLESVVRQFDPPHVDRTGD